MNTAKIAITIFIMMAALPAWAGSYGAFDSTLMYPGHPGYTSKWRLIAHRYVNGDKAGAQQMAKELLPSVEKQNYEEIHNASKRAGVEPYTCAYNHIKEVNMLKAIISGDDKTVQGYIQNNYDLEDDLLGFDVGLKETITVLQRELALIGAEPIYGRSSLAYLCAGSSLAALLYADGQKEKAKQLAKELLSLNKNLKANRTTAGKNPSKESDDRDDVFYRGVLEDNNDVVAKYIPIDCYADDSIGRRLENAYGRIYLFKRLKIDLHRLAYAYRELGRAQALAGNYQESERAYKTALRLAEAQYGSDYPEIPLLIRSEYAGMLRVAGKTDEANKIAAGLTPSSYREVELKAHPERASQPFYGPSPSWGKEGY